MFNHKGGVSKTTSAFHLGWMLAEKGKKVVLVDADSQCNLSNVAMDEDKFEQFYVDNPDRNLKGALSPAFEAKPSPISPFDCVKVKNRDGLLLIPGSFDLSEYEVSLGISFTLSETMITLKNLPGSFAFLFARTAEATATDYIIIDMNPSLSAINQALLISSDFFIVPTAPDSFSIMAVRSLAQVLPKWEKWGVRARRVFSDAYYPLPVGTPRFLGTVVQGFNMRKGRPTQANRQVIEKLEAAVSDEFVRSIEREGMMLPLDHYEQGNFCLAVC
jgi:cellulose biosynthesis protein BcsQ